jgi:hypothetical protein
MYLFAGGFILKAQIILFLIVENSKSHLFFVFSVNFRYLKLFYLEGLPNLFRVCLFDEPKFICVAIRIAFYPRTEGFLFAKVCFLRCEIGKDFLAGEAGDDTDKNLYLCVSVHFVKGQ